MKTQSDKLSVLIAFIPIFLCIFAGFIVISCENQHKTDIQIQICPPEGYAIIFDGTDRYTWRIPGSRYIHVLMFRTAKEAINNAWLFNDSQLENFYRYNWKWDTLETCD